MSLTSCIHKAWTDLFLEIVDNNVPLKQHRVKHENQPKWLTPEILDIITRIAYLSIQAKSHTFNFEIWVTFDQGQRMTLTFDTHYFINSLI